ncbi:MAG: hypothetical protein R6U26_00215 [Candidatus Undinarchaeales archaeon]
MNYFKRSQRIKRYIEETEIPLRLKRYYMEDKWHIERKPFPKLIGDGSISSVYRIGKLKNRFVAYRRITDDNTKAWFKHDFSKYLKLFENYCRNAEKLKKEGKRVPAFCVGVIYRKDGENKEAGLLTEDLTAGGHVELVDEHARKYGVINKIDIEPKKYGFVKGEGEKIYYDLDDYANIDYDEFNSDNLKYMSKDAVITINF